MVLQVGCGTSTLAHDLINCTLRPHAHKTQHTHANRTRTRTRTLTYTAGNLARHVVSIDTCAPAIEQMQALRAPQRPATNKTPSHGRGRGKRKGGGQSAAPAPPEPAGAAGIPLSIDGSVLCPHER